MSTGCALGQCPSSGNDGPCGHAPLPCPRVRPCHPLFAKVPSTRKRDTHHERAPTGQIDPPTRESYPQESMCTRHVLHLAQQWRGTRKPRLSGSLGVCEPPHVRRLWVPQVPAFRGFREGSFENRSERCVGKVPPITQGFPDAVFDHDRMPTHDCATVYTSNHDAARIESSLKEPPTPQATAIRRRGC